MFAKEVGPGQVGADLVEPDFQELSAGVGAQQEELQASHLRGFQYALRHLHRYYSPVKGHNRKVYQHTNDQRDGNDEADKNTLLD